MTYRYVPVLRPKRGERNALRDLSPAARKDVVPLFLLTPEKYVGKKATQKRPAVSPPNRLVSEIEAAWGTLPFYLDASMLPYAGGPHPLTAIAARARARQLNLIPATWRGANPQYQQAVNAVVSADRRGVALRLGLQSFSSAATWINQWNHPLNRTDLLVDVGNNVEMVDALGNALDANFANLTQANRWQTVTLIGTSRPDNFQGWLAGLRTIKRIEWTLWQRLSNALSYRLHYGDYATVPFTPAPSGIRYGYPINVVYTLRTSFLVCRGVSTTGIGAVDPKPQLTGHARNIVAYPKRGSLANCWADREIDAIATGQDPKYLEHWVRIGVNRHIELVRSRLP